MLNLPIKIYEDIEKTAEAMTDDYLKTFFHECNNRDMIYQFNLAALEIAYPTATLNAMIKELGLEDDHEVD